MTMQYRGDTVFRTYVVLPEQHFPHTITTRVIVCHKCLYAVDAYAEFLNLWTQNCHATVVRDQ